jgi:hypothetical protein
MNAGYIISVFVYWFARYVSDTTAKELVLLTDRNLVLDARVMMRCPTFLSLGNLAFRGAIFRSLVSPAIPEVIIRQ